MLLLMRGSKFDTGIIYLKIVEIPEQPVIYNLKNIVESEQWFYRSLSCFLMLFYCFLSYFFNKEYAAGFTSARRHKCGKVGLKTVTHTTEKDELCPNGL